MTKQLLIQQILNLLNVTPYGLEQITGIGRANIGYWKTGQREPETGSIFQLMYFFEKITGDKETTEYLFSSFINVGINAKEGK